ncbi:MAG: nitroreductase family protein [Elusimicrobia bacterium]|nr:nitroreductase family protein [Elusimicrobiota bacterium]
MTHFLKIVSDRRSIRKYSNKPVEMEKIRKCLESARLAPSACNSQPYKFIVINDPEIKNRVSKAAFSGAYSICGFAQSAPVLIAVVSQKQKMTAWLGNQIQNINFRYIDMGIAIEHFVLQATELGLGTCWIGWFNQKEVANILGIPDNCRVEIMLSLGYPQENPPVRTKKTFEQIASFNHY